jgi:hypothetical protein
MAQGRGIFVACHLLAITLMALPAPAGGMNRNSWKDPTVQGELQIWTERLNGWGVQATQPELEDTLWLWANRYMKVRAEILQPFDYYSDSCGTGQSWRMFVAPHRFPTRLQIDVEEQGQWRTVYVERDPHRDWLGTKLDHYRFRSAIFRFGWQEYSDDLQHFANWVAAQAFRDFHEADHVRVQLVRYRTPSPEEVRENRRPAAEFLEPVVVEREAAR